MIHKYILDCLKKKSYKEHSWDPWGNGNTECILDNIIMLVLMVSG